MKDSNTEILNTQQISQSCVPTLASIGFSTIGGTIIGGLPGGAIGFTTSVLDEYLIRGNYTAKHYLTTSTFCSNMVFTPAASLLTKAFPSLSTAFYVGSYAMTGLTSYYANDFISFKDKVELPLDSFLTVNKLFDEREILSSKEVEKIYNKLYESPSEALSIIADDVQAIYNNEFLCTFVQINGLNLANIVINQMFLQYLASYSAGIFITQLINNHAILANFQHTAFSLSALSPLKGVAWEATKIIGAYISQDAISFYINSTIYSLTRGQFNRIIEKSTEIILEDGNGKKILADENGKEIIQELTVDLFKLVFHGADKLDGVFSQSTQSLISLYNLVRFSDQALAPYLVKLVPIQMYLESMVNYSKTLAKNSTETGNKVWELKNHITDNIQQISLRNGVEFIKYEYNSLLAAQNRLTEATDANTKLKSFIQKLAKNLDNVIDLFYFGYNFITKQIDIAKIPLVKHAINEVSSFLSSNLDFQIDSTDLILSKERIEKLFEILSRTTNNANHTQNDQNKIIFKNYSLVLDNKTLVKIDYFEFASGEHYAITGKSGCGKTSTLIDLKEGVFGALSSSGEISIPQNANIMFIDQKLYLPKYKSLLEIIYFPNILKLLNEEQTLKLKDKIISLFKELEIDEFINDPNNTKGLVSRLDSKDFKLSGGQEKKIAIIQAIINKPDILILDEIFTGLDTNSLIGVQQAINKYLPEVTILSVDHHAEDNNYNGFYSSEAHFAEGKATEKTIVAKLFEEVVITTLNEKTTEWGLSETCPIEDNPQYLNAALVGHGNTCPFDPSVEFP